MKKEQVYPVLVMATFILSIASGALFLKYIQIVRAADEQPPSYFGNTTHSDCPNRVNTAQPKGTCSPNGICT